MSRSHTLLLCALFVVTLAPPATAQSNDEVRQRLAELRLRLSEIDAEIGRLDGRSAALDARAEVLATEIAALERERNLGPVQRTRLSLLRRQSATLGDERSAIDRARAALGRAYENEARRTMPLLSARIERVRAAYESEPITSEARVLLFREFEGLLAERQALRAAIQPDASLLILEIEIEESDTITEITEKSELLADNRDLLARVLGLLGSWKRELIEDRDILADVRDLEEENAFWRSTDPTDPGSRGVRPLRGRVSLPPELAELAGRVQVPPEGVRSGADYDRIIDQVEEIELELEEYILAMTEKIRIFDREIRERSGTP